MKSRARWIFGGLIFGFLTGIVISLAIPQEYVSIAKLRIVRSTIPASLIADETPITVEAAFAAEEQDVLSRNSLLNLIATHDLYPDLRRTSTKEDALEAFRKAVKIERSAVDQFTVSVRYADPATAQTVTRDLVARFIDNTNKQRVTTAMSAAEFFRAQADSARWAMDTPPADFKTTRLRYPNREAAEYSYNQRLEKLQTAQMMVDLLARKRGDHMQALQQPTKPDTPEPVWGLHRQWFIAVCAAAGLLVGALVAALVRPFPAAA